MLEMAPKAEGQDPAGGPMLEDYAQLGQELVGGLKLMMALKAGWTGSCWWPNVGGCAQLGLELVGGLNSLDGWNQTVVYSSIPAHRLLIYAS